MTPYDSLMECGQEGMGLAEELRSEGHGDCEIGMGLLGASCQVIAGYTGLDGADLLNACTDTVERLIADNTRKN